MNTSVATQQKTWAIDPAHSKIEFSVSHMVISSVTGFFKQFEGKAISEGEDFTNARVEVLIEASSIDTNNEQRDAHLKSEDFLDVGKQPKITFHSTSIRKTGDNTYKITGNFSLRGVTKSIELDVKHNGTVKDTYGNTRAGFKVTGQVNRKDYGVNWHAVLDNGGLVAGDVLDINANVEIVQQ